MEIITLPNKTLRQKAKKVSSITPAVKEIVSDMTKLALDWEKNRPHEISVALAANQVNILQQIIILRDQLEETPNPTFTALINPSIVKRSEFVSSDFEGCLSVPEIYGLVPRHEKIKVEAINIKGKKISLDVDGFLARTLQHEIDHLNGIVFIDRIKEDPDAFFKLTPKGKLKKINYDKKIRNNRLLW